MNKLMKDKKVLIAALMIVLTIGVVFYNQGIFGQEFLEKPPPSPLPDPTIKITSVSRSPTDPTTGQSVVITAKIYEHDGGKISEAYLYYSTSDQAVENKAVKMTRNSNIFTATIPGQLTNVKVTYYVKAIASIGSDVSSSTYSYTVKSDTTTSTSTTDAVIITGNMNVYLYENGQWVSKEEGAQLSGTIRIELQISTGKDLVSGVKFIITDTATNSVVYETVMAGVSGVDGLYRTEFDTTTLPNGVYDFQIKIFDNGGKTILTQSIWDTGDFSVGSEINSFVIYTGVIIVGIMILFVLLKRYKKM